MRGLILSLIAVAALVACPQVTADVVLRYGFTAGQTLIYDCTSTGEGVIQAMGRTDPLRTSATFAYVVSCTEVSPEGNMTLVHEVQEPQITAMWGSQPIATNVNIPTVITVIEPGGRVLSTQVQQDPAAGAGSLSGMMPGTGFDVGQFFGELRGPSFPAEPLGPGSKWQDQVTVTTQSGQPMVIDYVTALLDFARLHDRPCARLQTECRVPLDLSLSGGGLFTATGSNVGSQISYFDYEAGRVLRYDGTSDTEMVMQTPQLFGGAGQQTSVQMNLRSITSVVLREG